MSVFDNKLFNGEVFKGYIDRIPNPNRTELIRSRAIRPRPDLATAMADQDGGNYLTTTLKGLINNNRPLNYDGSTNITADSTVTFKHSRVVVGRAAAWTEKDFSYDITGGQDFIENIAEQISEYWNEVDQATIVNVLTGVFNMSDEEGRRFVDLHTTDVSNTDTSTDVGNGTTGYGCMSAVTLNNAIQKACGDNKGRFSLAIMHSVVSTNLENLKLLAFMKYTDSQGIERELSLATLNGKTVLIDDTMPHEDTVGTPGVYTLKIKTAPAANDSITIFGTEYTWVANGTDSTDTNLVLPSTVNASNCAQVLYNKLSALTSGTATKYNITRSTDTITFTQKTTAYGYHHPVVSVTGTLEVDEAQTTASVEYTKYTTFVLGDGAIEYTDCGAKVPYEVDRSPSENGGQDTLYSRQRKCFAPYGISFTMRSMASLSPTDDELKNGVNWELVNSATEVGKQYISHKTIPIARIISRG